MRALNRAPAGGAVTSAPSAYGLRFQIGALVGGLFIAFVLGYWALQRNGFEEQLRFDHQARDAAHSIELRLHAYEEMLRGMGAFFDADEAVTRSEFRGFVRYLDLPARYPGVQWTSFGRYVR